MAGNWSQYKRPHNNSRFSSNAALNYISQLLMDGEYLGDHKCMFVESTSYMAMEKELTGLLDNSSSTSECETVSFGVLEEFENEDEMEPQEMLSGQEMQGKETGILSIEPQEGILINFEQDMNSNNFVPTALPHVYSSYVEGSSKSFSISGQLSPNSSQVLFDEFLAQGEVSSVQASENSNQVLRADISLVPENFKSDNSTHDHYVHKNNTDQPDDQLKNPLSSKGLVLWNFDGNRHAEPESESKLHGDVSKTLHSLPPPPATAQAKALEFSDLASAGLVPMLVECAQAVSSNDVKEARRLINCIRTQSTPFGSWKQRLAHYFVEAFAAKLSGNGARLYTSLTKYSPSVAEMLKALRVCMNTTPFSTIPHFYANEMILHACEGESRLHIVDFGILYGIQWSGLIQDLANRQGGPPRLRITGIDFPQPGYEPASRVEETGRRLADFARLWGVPFHYDALAIKWENVQPASLHLRHDEVLVVNSMFRLRQLMDETMMAESPRKIVLKKIRSMNPKIFIQGITDTGNNSPLGFIKRFHECFAIFLNKFEAIDACIPRDSSERLLLEQICFGRVILNILACEGLERIERGEPYSKWHALTQRAGFKILPLHTSTYNRARDLLKMYHRDFVLGEDGGWLLLGWKGLCTAAVSAWEIKE